MPLSAQLDAAMAAAAAAGDVIRRSYGQRLAVRVKQDRSPVTEADVAAERAIREVLAQRFPDYGFYGEETGAEGLQAEYLWLVDPIDGTQAFVREYPMFSTQIALMHRGRLVLGVSAAQVYGETAWAERGAGAFLDGRRLAVSDVATLPEAAVSTGNLRTLARGPRWQSWGQVVSTVSRIRGYGDFLQYHLLAGGKIDAVVESDVNILDIAALAVIVEEAGGRFTDLDGAALTLETTSVLASNGRLHEPLLAALAG